LAALKETASLLDLIVDQTRALQRDLGPGIPSGGLTHPLRQWQNGDPFAPSNLRAVVR
jgi:hypothetical protein